MDHKCYKVLMVIKEEIGMMLERSVAFLASEENVGFIMGNVRMNVGIFIYFNALKSTGVIGDPRPNRV